MPRVLRSSIRPKAKPPTPPNAASLSKLRPTRRRKRAGADPWTIKRKPNPNPRPRAPPATHHTCRICTEEQPADQFVAWIPSSRRRSTVHQIPSMCLDHLSRNPRRRKDPVCKTCIGSSMSARLDMLGARKLSSGCLEPGCETHWEFRYIMKHLPVQSLEKYNMGMLNVWKETAQIVTCVNDQCGAEGLLDPVVPGYPHISCAACSLRFCAQCKAPWHTGLTCADYGARHINAQMTTPEKETLKLMQEKDGKRCPNCWIVIEKDGGCDSMYCWSCKTYFNWNWAASAVPGSKPAVTMPTGWGGPVNVVCEMDALDGVTLAPPPGPTPVAVQG